MIRVLGGDCRAVLTTLPPDCLDACVTDPPYELAFMGRRWDSTGVAFDPATWRTVYRVLKPGAYLVAFGGTRTYHRMVCAIEDAGFEIRDTLCWLYGSGFPKSLDVSKAIDKAAGAVREVVGPRVRLGDSKPYATNATSQIYGVDNGHGGWRPDQTAPATPEAAQWQGWGTALKPAHEPIVLARKPLSERTVAANVLAHGVGGLNIDACRVEHAGEAGSWGSGSRPGGFGNVGADKGGAAPCGEYNAGGRWPANVLHDGSTEVMAAFAAFGEKTSGKLLPTHNAKESSNGSMSGKNYAGRVKSEFGGDTGTAARFFYSAKASAADRAGSKHPTVKPIALMRWLTRLVTPPGGHVLDPFAGSGTTGEAAMLEGFDCTMIEQDAAYRDDIAARMARWPGRDGPLFATMAAE